MKLSKRSNAEISCHYAGDRLVGKGERKEAKGQRNESREGTLTWKESCCAHWEKVG